MASYPEDVLKLGHYLGPIIDVIGQVMTAKILTQNGQINIQTTDPRGDTRSQMVIYLLIFHAQMT